MCRLFPFVCDITRFLSGAFLATSLRSRNSVCPALYESLVWWRVLSLVCAIQCDDFCNTIVLNLESSWNLQWTILCIYKYICIYRMITYHTHLHTQIYIYIFHIFYMSFSIWASYRFFFCWPVMNLTFLFKNESDKAKQVWTMRSYNIHDLGIDTWVMIRI